MISQNLTLWRTPVRVTIDPRRATWNIARFEAAYTWFIEQFTTHPSQGCSPWLLKPPLKIRVILDSGDQYASDERGPHWIGLRANKKATLGSTKTYHIPSFPNAHEPLNKCMWIYAYSVASSSSSLTQATSELLCLDRKKPIGVVTWKQSPSGLQPR